MKKVITFLFLSLSLIFNLNSQTPFVIENINSSNLNIRTGPGLGNSIITSIAPGKKLVAIEQDSDNNGHIWFKVNIPTNDIDIPSEGWVIGSDNSGWYMQPQYDDEWIKLTGDDVLIRKFAGGSNIGSDLVWILNQAFTEHDHASTYINQRFAIVESTNISSTIWYKINVTNNCTNGPNGSMVTTGWLSGQYAMIENYSGGGGNPSIDVNPNNLDFGTVSVGSSSQLYFEIENTGDAPLSVSSISKPSWINLNWASGNIDPGFSKTVAATFNPSSDINYSSEITINSNASSGDDNLDVSGEGTTNTQAVISVANNLNFGEVAIGSSSTQLFTIFNNGNAALNINSITTPSWIDLSWNSGTIAPGFSKSVDITFSPVDNISYSGTVSINSNASSGNDEINISGFGESTNTGGISTSPTSLSFGDVSIGIPFTQTINIINTTGNSVSVNSVQTPNGFTASSNTFSFTGSTYNLSITFTPSSVGAFSGDIVINSNPVLTVPVNGNGVIGTNNIISGVVKDISLNQNTAVFEETAISNNVEVKLKDGNTTLETLVPSTNGTFSFSGYTGSGYTIEVEYSYLGKTYYSAKNNVTTGNNVGVIKVPAGLLQQIEDLRNNLKFLTANLSYDEPGYETVSVDGYDVNLVDQVLTTYDYVEDDFSIVIEKLGRLLVAEKAILAFYEDAAYTGDLTTYTIMQLVENISSELMFFEIFEGCVSGIPEIGSVLSNLIDQIQNTIYINVTNILEITFQIVDNDELKSLIETQISAIWLNIDNAQNSVSFLPDELLDSVYKIINNFILQQYLNASQIHVNQSANITLNPNPLGFNLSFPNAFMNSQQAEGNSDYETFIVVDGYMDAMLDASNIFGVISNSLDLLEDLVSECSPVHLISKGTQFVFTAFKVAEYGSLGYGTFRGMKHLSDTKKSSGENLDNNVFRNPPEQLQVYTKTTLNTTLLGLTDAFQNHNQYMTGLIDDYQSGEEITSDDIEGLRNQEQLVVRAINSCLYPIYSVSGQADTLINDFSDLYFFQLLPNVSDCNDNRANLYSKLLLFGLDPDNSDSETELIQALNETISSNNSLPIVISQFHTLIQNIPSPAFPVITEFNYSKEMEPSSMQEVTIKVNNFGTVTAADAYLKIYSENELMLPQDSIYLGTLELDDDDVEVNFSITAPAVDTISSFRIVLYYGDGISSHGKGAAILVREYIPTQTQDINKSLDEHFSLEISPNPNEGILNLKYELFSSEDLVISILNSYGQKVYEIPSKKYISGVHNLEIDLSNLNNGSYFLSIATRKQQDTKLFIISK